MGNTEDKGGGDVQDTIHINPFDPDSIDEAIKKLEKRIVRLQKRAESLFRNLTNLGVDKDQ